MTIVEKLILKDNSINSGKNDEYLNKIIGEINLD